MLAIGIRGNYPANLRQARQYLTQASLERTAFAKVRGMAQNAHRRHRL
jgi:hypothetical protein